MKRVVDETLVGEVCNDVAVAILFSRSRVNFALDTCDEPQSCEASLDYRETHNM